MDIETQGAPASESGESGLSAVEEAAFNDTTPIEETFEGEDENVVGEESEEEESEEIQEPEEIEDGEGEDEIQPASFTDLEAANKHIAKVNRENAAKRVALKEYQVFEQFNPESKQWFVETAQKLLETPEAGAQELLRVAKNILGEDALKEPEFDENTPMTLKQLKEWQAKEESAKEQARQAEKAREEEEAAVKQIFSKAEELGYKEADPWRHTLLSVAAASEKVGGTNGNLDKAHEKVAAMKQAVIDEYINGKSAQANEYPTTSEGAQPGNVGQSPKDWNDFIDQATEMANAADNVGK